MFVHIVRRDAAPMTPPDNDKDPRDFFNSDHQVVGGSFYLSDAPEGQIVHDSFGVFVGKGVPGRYEILVGFGHVSGRRGRAKVLEPGSAIVDDDMVVIGSFTIK
jgi:hypothetical protein